MRLVARVAAGMLLCNCLGLPRVGGASGAVPVRLLGARPLPLLCGGYLVFCALVFVCVYRLVVLYCVFVSVACAPRVGCARVFRARAPSGGAGLVDG